MIKSIKFRELMADEEKAHTPDQVIPDVQAWLPLAVRFLKRRG